MTGCESWLRMAKEARVEGIACLFLHGCLSHQESSLIKRSITKAKVTLKREEAKQRTSHKSPSSTLAFLASLASSSFLFHLSTSLHKIRVSIKAQTTPDNVFGSQRHLQSTASCRHCCRQSHGTKLQCQTVASLLLVAMPFVTSSEHCS